MDGIILLNSTSCKQFQCAIGAFFQEYQKDPVHDFINSNVKLTWEEVCDAIDTEALKVMIILEDGAIIGLCEFHDVRFRENDARVQIEFLYIVSDKRRQGYGSRLLCKIQSLAKESGKKDVALNVAANNEAMMCFLKKNGYEDERLYLTKKLSQDTDDFIDEHIIAVTPAFAREQFDAFQQLMLINTKAHLYTDQYSLEDAAAEIENMISYLENNQAMVFSYVEDGAVAGYIWLFSLHDYGRYGITIRTNSVFSQYRGKQISKKMVRHAETVVKKKFDLLTTYIDSCNTPIAHVYFKTGLTIERYLMVKRLAI